MTTHLMLLLLYTFLIASYDLFPQNETAINSSELLLEKVRTEFTSRPFLFRMFKWLSVAAGIILPMIILPLIALYARRVKRRADSSSCSNDESRIRNLQHTIVLLPVKPEADVFLQNQPQSSIVLKEKNGRLAYNLEKENSVECLQSGQLYHPLTGLIFNPIYGQCGPLIEPQNQVYNSQNNLLYERCYCMCYEPNLRLFHLPTVVANNNSIRFLMPEEMPKDFVQIYRQLLDCRDKEKDDSPFKQEVHHSKLFQVPVTIFPRQSLQPKFKQEKTFEN